MDGEPCALSSATPTPPASWLPDKTTEPLTLSRSGMTCARLTADHGEALLTSFRAAFLAKTSAPPEKAQASTEREAGSGQRWRESSVRYDLDACSWRTHRTLFEEVLPESSVTLPLSGMMRDGVVYQPWSLERLTEEIDSGSLLPTPTATQYGTTNNGKRSDGTTFATAGTPSLSTLAGGPLSPSWIEWLMGWPIGWTDCDALETDKCQQWQREHGSF